MRVEVMLVTRSIGVVVFLLCIPSQTLEMRECKFPPDWGGHFFKTGERDALHITRKYFGLEGLCYRQYSDNKFLLYRTEEMCYRCMEVWKRHENLLEYRMGPCYKNINPDVVPCYLGENPVNRTIVNLRGRNAPCPMFGTFSFTYKEGSKNCNSKKSSLTQCADRSTSILRFARCSESRGRESTGNMFYRTIISQERDPEETLTCKATWPREEDPSEFFMVGTLDHKYKRSDEQRVRCFLVKQTKRWVQIAQSQNSSCNSNLFSSMAGYKTMKLMRRTPVEPPSCVFPSWAVNMGTLYSFSYLSRYEFKGNGSVLSVSNFSISNKRTHVLSRTKCLEWVEEREGYAKIVTQTLAGCKQMYKCLRIFKRTENILEIQEGFVTTSRKAACFQAYLDEQRTTFTSLFRENSDKVSCPINGIHNVTEIFIKGSTTQCDGQGFTNLDIRCGDAEHLVQFYQECRSDDGLRLIEGPKSNYICLGGWQTLVPISEIPDPSFSGYSSNLKDPTIFAKDDEEVDTRNITYGFLVVAQELTPERRICLIYTKLKDSYSWTVDKTSCRRNIRPGVHGRLKFNTTVLETCAAPALNFAGFQIFFSAVLWLFR